MVGQREQDSRKSGGEKTLKISQEQVEMLPSHKENWRVMSGRATVRHHPECGILNSPKAYTNRT